MSSPPRHLVHEIRRLRHVPTTTHGVDYHMLREFNRLLVLNCVREQGPLARMTIAQRTGLSRTTVGNIMDALLNEGLVREGRMLDAPRSGGRRAILVHFNANAGRVVGIDMGRTHLIFLLTDLETHILARYAAPFDADRGPLVCLPEAIAELHAFLAQHEVTWDRVLGIGLGIPGPLNVDRRMLVAPPHMPGWDGVDVHALLSRELPVPIHIENDANMGALGECRLGAGRGVADLAYIKIGTGIGAGLVMHGRVYAGSNGSAGELGHITIDEDGPLCECGNRGCLETLAAARAIIADACTGASLAQRWGTHEDDPLPYEGLPALAGREGVDMGEVIVAAQEGDHASIAAIEHAGERIGIALAGLVNLFNPSVILIDGGVTRAGERLLTPMRAAITTRSLAATSMHMQLVAGELGDNAIALGAVSLVLDATFTLPTISLTRDALPAGVTTDLRRGKEHPRDHAIDRRHRRYRES